MPNDTTPLLPPDPEKPGLYYLAHNGGPSRVWEWSADACGILALIARVRELEARAMAEPGWPVANAEGVENVWSAMIRAAKD